LTTIQRPSGLTTGAPTRFMSQMSSWAGIRFVSARAADGTAKQANNSTATKARAATGFAAGSMAFFMGANVSATAVGFVYLLPDRVPDARLPT
jgi:hypothetical protein